MSLLEKEENVIHVQKDHTTNSTTNSTSYKIYYQSHNPSVIEFWKINHALLENSNCFMHSKTVDFPNLCHMPMHTPTHMYTPMPTHKLIIMIRREYVTASA